MVQRAGGGQEIARRILGIDACLEGVAGQRDLFLRERQRLARGDSQLPFDKIGCRSPSRVTGCSTCSRVFISMNQNRVGAKSLGRVDDEFDRASTRNRRSPGRP